MDSSPSKTAAAPSSCASVDSSSSSPYRRRNVLSPRQRRLLQASARAKASAARNATAADSVGANNCAAIAAESGTPFSRSSPLVNAVSLSSPSATAGRSPASSPDSRSITPAELKVPLSPIMHTSSPSKRSSCATTIVSASSGSGASTAVLTEATTVSFENGFRRRLRLNDPASVQTDPMAAFRINNTTNSRFNKNEERDVAITTDTTTALGNENIESASGDVVFEEGECVAEAMRGKVSDRIRALNDHNRPARKEISSQHGVQGSGRRPGWSSTVNRKPSAGLAQNISTDGTRWKNSRRSQCDSSNSASIGESIEEEVENIGPLHEKIMENERTTDHPEKLKTQCQSAHGPIQEKAKKLSSRQQKATNEKIRAQTDGVEKETSNSPYSRRKQSKLRTQQPRFPSDEVDSERELRYYRISFKGVVSLFPKLDVDTDAQPISPSNTTEEVGGGGTYLPSHVSYGEVVATYSPEIMIPVIRSANNGRVGHTLETQFLRAIRVDSILTRGYAPDASSSDVSHRGIADRSDPIMMSDYKSHHGYLLLCNNHSASDRIIAEPLTMAVSESLCSSTETGTFLYRVTASSPISVLTGPSADAMGLGLGLLPGTVHEVSLRISIPVAQQSNVDDPDDADNTLVDDADAGEIKFLRLGQRRGWIADRRIDAADRKLRVSYLVQDVTNNGNGARELNNSVGAPSSLSVVDGLFDDVSFESSTLNSAANSSFYSSVIASSVATPSSVRAHRRRNRRRPRTSGGGLEWPQQPTVTLPSLLRKDQCKAEGSFEEAGSSITGGGTDVACDTDGDSSSNGAAQVQPAKSYYLMRVIAPLGLKILDSPNFQVSNLIHNPSPKKDPHNSPSTTTSPFARTNAMIGSMSTESSSPSVGAARRRGFPRVRLLARGQIFEASQRMEITGDSSLYTNGQGLIKLADGSGWAIVPHEEDLIAQFKNFHGDELLNINEIAPFEEIGSGLVGTPVKYHRLTPPKQGQEKSSERSLKSVVWLRIVAPPIGIKVLLPPPQSPNGQQQALKKESHNTPLKRRDNQAKMNLSTSHDSEVSSSVVSGSLFDSVWSRVTPKEKERDHPSVRGRHNVAATISPKPSPPMPPVIPCGAVVPVERWDPSTTSKKSFVRLFNGQGWIPRCLGDVLYAHTLVDAPDIRLGSFWFRVISCSGLDVRHGPSHNAPAIKSDNGASFRFECGEFLRASEVLTLSHHGTTESYAKLYRTRNHLNHENNASKILFDRFSALQSLTTPGEWVQVHSNGNPFLKECSSAPSIERNRKGIRYSVICAEINIHSGPSLRAEVIGKLVCEGDDILVLEKVTTDCERATWLRLKSGGWVCSVINDGETVTRARPHGPNNAEHLVRQILDGRPHAA